MVKDGTKKERKKIERKKEVRGKGKKKILCWL